MPVAWGLRVQSDTPKEDEFIPQEEECIICRNARTQVKVSPCNHELCQQCVDFLRREAVYKPDEGVKCPFCRGFVDHYEPINRDGHVVAQLEDANSSAQLAARQRKVSSIPQRDRTSMQVPEQQRVEEVDDAGGSSAAQWTCRSCKAANNFGVAVCSKCRKAIPDSLAKSKAQQMALLKNKDVMSFSDVEMKDAACQKLHLLFLKAFADAGTPVQNGKTQVKEESLELVLRALPANGQQRLLHIIQALCKSGHLPHICHHIFGNYTVQNLLDAAYLLRTALMRLQEVGSGRSFWRGPPLGRGGNCGGCDDMSRLVCGP
eukprot:jgi/Botrbrau1/6099/Bobra.177_1s0036.1